MAFENFPTEAPSPISTPPPQQRSVARGCLRILWEIIETLVLAGLLYLGINAVTARVRVQGMSMRPTFQSGEFVLVYRWAYRWSTPKRGDIIIFHPDTLVTAPTHSPEDDFIKRIIGLPGETVTIRGGKVYIDGTPLPEPYIAEAPHYQGRWQVPPGKVFVLGDNRNNSTDSHVFGPIPIDQIVGRALLVYWPPEAWRVLSDPQYPPQHENTVKYPQAGAVPTP